MPEFHPSSDSPDRDRTVVDPAVMAERRARRAEMAEEGLAQRVSSAEELADRLRHRTDELERDLATAARERDDLLAQLRSRERALVTVRQQEESERRRRHEVEVESDAGRRRLEQEVSDLRVRVGAAETWTAELSDELTRTRNDLDATRRELEGERAERERLERGTEDQQAMSRALESRREEMAGEVAALRAQAAGLADKLDEEERERDEAQRGLVAERERAEAQITLLEHELERRAEIHDAVLAQLRGLGGEVARVRDGVAQDGQRRAATERTLSEVAATARRLRSELDELERARDQVAAELRAAQRALVARDETLAQARAEVGAVRADLEAVLADTTRHADELAAAQQTLVETRQALAGSQQALAGSERALSDARTTADALRGEAQAQRAERDRLSQLIAEGVSERETALAEQQRGFETQVQGFEHTVTDLRGRLASAAAEFDQRLGEEHAARQAAQAELVAQRDAFAAERRRLEEAQVHLEASRAQLAAELDEARATIALERERADAGEALAAHVRGDRDLLAAELARRDALDAHVRGTLKELRVELDGLRVQSDARDAREAAVERLVVDLVDTARSLREGFDRELEEVRGRLERTGQAELEAAEQRLGAMRTHLESSVDQLRGELLREQAARRAAEESLGEERTRVEAAGLAAVDAAVARDDLARELQARLAAEEEARSALAAAEQELTLLRRSAPPSRDDALAVVESLTRAARRLREESDLVEEPEAEAESAAPEVEAAAVEVEDPVSEVEAEAPAVEAASEDVAPSEPVAEAPVDEEAVVEAPVAATPAPAVEHRPMLQPHTAAARAAQPAPVVPRIRPAAPAPVALRTDAVPVRPRVVAPEDRVPTLWLTPALQRLAVDEPALAVAALVTLLPSLGPIAAKDLVCDVTVRGSGTWRVVLEPGSAEVATLTRASGDPDVTVVGDVASLAPLVAGGTQRRLPGIDVIGRRRKLRRLLKDRRGPVSLADLHAASIVPSAAVLLELLVRGVSPAWVGGADVVDFAVSGPYGGTWRVSTEPGAVPVVSVPGPGDRAPDATIHIADVAILSLLAALPLPLGERLLIGGDVDAATAVTGLLSRAQGLSAVPA